MNGDARNATSAIVPIAVRQGRLGPGRGVTGAERRQQAGWLAGGRGQPDEAEGQHHGQERGCVGHEGDRIAERRYRRPGQRRTGDPTEVELGRVERDGGQELSRRHQVGQDGLLERADQRAGRALHGDQRHQRGRAGPARGHQHGQQQGAARGGQVAQDQDRPPGQPVGQRPADRRQQADRQEPARRHQHGPGGFPGVGDDQGTDRDGLHPGPDRGDQARRPQQGEGPVPERLQPGEATGAGRGGGLAGAGPAVIAGMGRTGQLIRGPAHAANLPAGTDGPAGPVASGPLPAPQPPADLRTADFVGGRP